MSDHCIFCGAKTDGADHCEPCYQEYLKTEARDRFKMVFDLADFLSQNGKPELAARVEAMLLGEKK